MGPTTGRYCVIIDEKHPGGWTSRRMLVARFVCQGDAFAYAIWRAKNCSKKEWTFVVETSKANKSSAEYQSTGEIAGEKVFCAVVQD